MFRYKLIAKPKIQQTDLQIKVTEPQMKYPPHNLPMGGCGNLPQSLYKSFANCSYRAANEISPHTTSPRAAAATRRNLCTSLLQTAVTEPQMKYPPHNLPMGGCGDTPQSLYNSFANCSYRAANEISPTQPPHGRLRQHAAISVQVFCKLQLPSHE